MIDTLFPIYITFAIFTLLAGIVLYAFNYEFSTPGRDDHEIYWTKIGARLIFSFPLWPLFGPLVVFYLIKAIIKHVVPLLIAIAKAAA